MSDQRLRRAGLAVFAGLIAITVGLLVLSNGLEGNPRLTYPDAEVRPVELIMPFVLSITVLLLLWFRPRNSVGWMLALAGACGGLCELGQAYGKRALVLDSDLPLGALALSLSAPLWVPAIVVPATLLLARYPSGSAQGRWARRVDRLAIGGLVVTFLAYSTHDVSTADAVKGARPPLNAPDELSLVLVSAGSITLLVCTLAVAAMTIRRLFRAEWPERPQLALLLTGTTISVLLAFLSPWESLASAGFALMPAAVAVGVLRYRLLGIEVVVRRTLLYGALTGAVAVVFIAVASGLSVLVPDGPAPQVLASSVVAIGLVPARDRLQRVVDRVMYGDRDDPWQALGRLGRGAVEGSALSEVVAAVAASLRLPGAQVRGVDGTAASWGQVPDEALSVPLTIAGDVVGELRVAPRVGERALAPADRRLLEAVAPLVALVLRGSALTAALEVERERVVHATEAERARLRRDLHDGLGPSLTGIGLGLEAVDPSVPSGRPRLVLERVRAEVRTSLEEVRRIIDDLRPGALETGDLLSLLRARAWHLNGTTAMTVDVEAPGCLDPLPPDVEAAALRIVEEALTNVVRHAHASHCTVAVSMDHALRIEVQDNGVGYAGPRTGGVGIASMQARAAALGGELHVSSDGGTRVVVELPLPVPA
jgi:signal transduction histidine kinase